MEDLIKKVLEGLKEDSNMDTEDRIRLDMLEEAIGSDDEKIHAMTHSIIAICVIEEFTPFELVNMASMLIMYACSDRMSEKGRRSTEMFFEHSVRTLESCFKDMCKENDHDSTDGDCNCECG